MLLSQPTISAYNILLERPRQDRSDRNQSEVTRFGGAWNFHYWRDNSSLGHCLLLTKDWRVGLAAWRITDNAAR